MNFEINKIIQHNVLVPWPLPDKCLNSIVTSPPYWGLRDYGVVGQLGLEKTIEEWLANMVTVFREAWRVLRDDGTLWVNIGDAYSHNGGAYGDEKSTLQGTKQSKRGGERRHLKRAFKPKDLIGMPWMLAFALRADGWYLRQDIIWHKPNPMPESASDRCTRSHEYIFMFSKDQRYYYDAYSIRTPYKSKTITTFGCGNVAKNSDGSETEGVKSHRYAKTVPLRGPKDWKTPDGWNTNEGSHGNIHPEGREQGKKGYQKKGRAAARGKEHTGLNGSWADLTTEEQQAGGANKRSVWTVSTSGFTGAHFATYPEDLVVDCIRASCPSDGIVGDPFMGSGTTGLVARKQGRNFIGLELNPKYIKLADDRLKKELGLFH